MSQAIGTSKTPSPRRRPKVKPADLDVRRTAMDAFSVHKPPLEARETELIGCDDDGNMFLWSTGNVRPVSTFDKYADGCIVSGHYVIDYKGHAITVHCGNYADGTVSMMHLAGGCDAKRMRREDVERMLLGMVIPDPVLEARISATLKALTEHLRAKNMSQSRGRI